MKEVMITQSAYKTYKNAKRELEIQQEEFKEKILKLLDVKEDYFCGGWVENFDEMFLRIYYERVVPNYVFDILSKENIKHDVSLDDGRLCLNLIFFNEKDL